MAHGHTSTTPIIANQRSAPLVLARPSHKLVGRVMTSRPCIVVSSAERPLRYDLLHYFTSSHTCAIAAAYHHQLCTALLLTPGREHVRGDSARNICFLRLHDFLSGARDCYAVPRSKINARITGRSDRRDSLSRKRKVKDSARKLNGAVDHSNEPRCKSRSRKRAREVSGIVLQTSD